MNCTTTISEFQNFAKKESNIDWKSSSNSIRMFLLAQVDPFIFEYKTKKVFEIIPFLEIKQLAFVQKLFILEIESLKFMKEHSFFKNRIELFIEQIEEKIESIDFVLENKDSLKKTIATITQ